MESIKNMLSGKNNTCTGKCKEKHEEGNKEKVYTTSSFKNKKKDNFDECVICLEEMKEDDLVTIIYCSHIFHKYCIDLWIEKKRFCPLCDQTF